MGNYKSGLGNYKSQGISYLVKQVATLTVNNSTTYVNTDLKFNARLGKSYMVYYYCTILSHSNADSKFILDLGTYVGTNENWGDAGLGQLNDALSVEATESGTTGVDEVEVLLLNIINVTTAGTITLQYAQQTADASNSLFYAGNVMTVIEY